MQGQLQGRLNPTLDSTSHSNNSLLPLQRDGRCRPHSPTCYPFKWFLLFMKTQGTGNLTFSVQFCQLNHFNRNHLSVIFLHNVFVPQKNSLVFTHARPAGGAEAQNEKKRGGGGCSWSFYQKDFVSDSANETEKSKHLISFLSHVTSSPWPFRLETMHRTHSQAAPAPSVIALFSSWYYAPGCVIKVQFNSFDVLTSWSKDMKRYDKQQRRKTD